MRKWLVFFCIFFIILSLVAYLSLNNSEAINNENEAEIYVYDKKDDEEVIIYDEIKNGKEIKMYNVDTEEILNLDLNDYLRGVVASEMPADYSLEALKAQAIVARTFLFKKIKEGHVYDADICSSSNHCQQYENKEEIFRFWKTLKCWSDEMNRAMWARINTAVVTTNSLVITYDGELINAYFHASSPVKTENSYEIWGKEYFPYLVSVQNVESEDYKYRHTTLDVEKGYFEDKIKSELNQNFNIGDGNISINSYTDSGRVRDVIVNGYVISAENLRKLFGIKSTFFTVENKEGGYIFNVVGYGHGIGMSQVGADYLGKSGKTYEEIIKYYYKRSNSK